MAARLQVLSKSLQLAQTRTLYPLSRMASSNTAAQAFGLQDPDLVRTQGFIAGKWRDALDGSVFGITNPATNAVLGHVADMGVTETKEAIAAAAAAFKTWSKTTARHRHDLLMKLHKLMLENNDDLGRIITLENGKILAEGKGENSYSASFVEWFAEEGVRAYGGYTITTSKSSLGGRKAARRRVWHSHTLEFPFCDDYEVVSLHPDSQGADLTRKLAPALAAGCTVVIKPPLETPFSALALAELAARAGIPDGVVNVVPTSTHTKDIGKEICENPTVRKVSFTGSTAVAKTLLSQSASTMKKMSLEAGGNAPFIIFDDADVEEAVTGAIASKFRASGQTCVCANRIYVQSGVYAEFAALLTERVSSFKVGNGLDESVTHGPLIHARALEKVERHIEDALNGGAAVLTGGNRLEGNFFLPTVLSDVRPDALLAKEETFGPLAALIKFETEEELIKLANDTEFGLAAYLYSRDVGRVWRVAEALEVGMVGTNTGLISLATIPFGGVKDSGLGREGSRHGLDEYLNIKYIAFGGL